MCCVFTIKMMFPINRGPQNPLVYILLTFRWFWRGKISRHAHMYYTYYILIGKKRCAINMTWWKVLILDHPEAAKKGFQENEHLWVLWLTRSFWKHQQEGSTWNFWTLLPWPLTHFHIHMRPSALPRAAAMRYCSPPSVKGINTSRAAWKGQKRNSLISTLSTISTIHHHFFCTLILSDHFVLIASCCALKKKVHIQGKTVDFSSIPCNWKLYPGGPRSGTDGQRPASTPPCQPATAPHWASFKACHVILTQHRWNSRECVTGKLWKFSENTQNWCIASLYSSLMSMFTIVVGCWCQTKSSLPYCLFPKHN